MVKVLNKFVGECTVELQLTEVTEEGIIAYHQKINLNYCFTWWQ